MVILTISIAVVLGIVILVLAVRLAPQWISRHRRMKAYYNKWRRLFERNLHPNVNEVRWWFRCFLWSWTDWSWPPGKFLICIKPITGNYPNLGAHRLNLDYDIRRIDHELTGEVFYPGQPYTRGNWVCIPFYKQQQEAS